jgi:hypothetical protein
VKALTSSGRLGRDYLTLPSTLQHRRHNRRCIWFNNDYARPLHIGAVADRCLLVSKIASLSTTYQAQALSYQWPLRIFVSRECNEICHGEMQAEDMAALIASLGKHRERPENLPITVSARLSRLISGVGDFLYEA